MSLLVFVYGLSAACVWAQTESGQDLVRSHAVEIISDEVTIDGILDEAVWKSTSTIGDLIQREPKTGQAPSERTEVYLLRDANHLYIGIEAYDSEPDKMVGSNMTRDASTRSQDTLQIILDTFHDQRNAYYFATNPSGPCSAFRHVTCAPEAAAERELDEGQPGAGGTPAAQDLGDTRGPVGRD